MIFNKMPFMLLALIFGISFLNPHIPVPLQEHFYALSLAIKSCIIFILPFIIFSLLFKAALNLAQKATRIISFILIGVCLSSFISLLISYGIGQWIYQFNLSLLAPIDLEQHHLQAAWTFSLPHLIPNATAMFLGLLLGILGGFFKVPQAQPLALALEKITTYFLKAITYSIPLFVTGFLMKLQHDNFLTIIFKDYSLIFIIIALSQMTYILIVYYLLNKRIFSSFLKNLKDMLPAAISGFCTMSSAATMPLTIIGTENNIKNKSLVESVIPATVNIHLVGDCFATPILAYAILKNYGFAEPSLISYFIFILYFILAKFSVAAIPGGGILVMLPILEAHMGFTGEMMSLITALYILFDPAITCANVLGNGAFAKAMDSFLNWSQENLFYLKKKSQKN